MANPNWKKGGKSPNPAGAGIKRKHSSRTIKGMVERFVKRNITPNKLQTMYDGLKPKEQLEFLCELLPYCLSKQTNLSMKVEYENMNDSDLTLLFNNVMSGITSHQIEPLKQLPYDSTTQQ